MEESESGAGERADESDAASESHGQTGSEVSTESREELLRELRRRGVDDEILESASEEGRLVTLPVELALGGVGTHTLSHVAREANINRDLLRDALRALGRPSPAPRERAFTDEDIELARLLGQLRDAGLPREGMLEVARVLGQGMSHTAAAVRRLIADALLRPGDEEHSLGLRYAAAAEHLSPLLGQVLEYDVRARIREAVRHELITRSELESGRLTGTREVAVAFADLVNFTRLGEQLPVDELGTVAGRLATLAARWASERRVQLVKTIGDAAMFVSPDASALVGAVHGLVAAAEADDEELPQLRVGIAFGHAVQRGGDWFGAPVNTASRITESARPGRILATEEAKERAGNSYDWQRKRRRRSFKGVEGRLRLYELAPKAKDARATSSKPKSSRSKSSKS